MGCVDDGVAAVGWSPDQEVVVIITKANKMIFMSKDFDMLSEISFGFDGEVPADQAVNVGWGKVETQFKGSAGKTKAATPEGPAQGLELIFSI